MSLQLAKIGGGGGGGGSSPLEKETPLWELCLPPEMSIASIPERSSSPPPICRLDFVDIASDPPATDLLDL